MKLLRKLYNRNDKENVELIRNSDLFDAEYYLKENKDVHMDAAYHYYHFGYKEGKAPSYEFSNDYYLETYKDVKDAGINPLLHYLKYGKKENRLIKKDNGISIMELYDKINDYSYSINIYKINNDTKRINLFFEKIDAGIECFSILLAKLFAFCNKNNYSLRIVYRNADLGELKKIFNNEKINITTKIEYLYLKRNNYLFVGNNDEFICTSYLCAQALLNSKNLTKTIYYYINKNGENIEEKYNISKVTFNKNVVCLVNEDKILKDIKEVKIKFTIEGNLNNDQDIYYKSNKLFIRGIELINKLYLANVLDYKSNDLFVVNNNLKFHLDSDTRVYNCDGEVSSDILFSIGNENTDLLIAYIDELSTKVENYINISKSVFELKPNNNNYILIEDEEYIDFKDKVLQIKSGEEDV